MIGYHGIPDASVVSFLLLLCITHSGLGKSCIFESSPLPSTDISETINTLKKFVLFDYPVSLPSNLKSDDLCFEFWQLHFISRELSRMRNVAGKNLIDYIEKTRDVFAELVDHCEIESDCVGFERSNISALLDSISSNFKAVEGQMEQTPCDFTVCSSVRCQQPDSSSTSYPGYSRQILGSTQTSKSALLLRHHWILILVPLLVCLLSVVKCSSRNSSYRRPLQV